MNMKTNEPCSRCEDRTEDCDFFPCREAVLAKHPMTLKERIIALGHAILDAAEEMED